MGCILAAAVWAAFWQQLYGLQLGSSCMGCILAAAVWAAFWQQLYGLPVESCVTT
jgi:hypothetical protein